MGDPGEAKGHDKMSFANWVRGGVSAEDTPPTGNLSSLSLKVGDVVRCTYDHGDCCWVFTPGYSYTVYCISGEEELILNGVDECFWDEVTYEFERVS